MPVVAVIAVAVVEAVAAVAEAVVAIGAAVGAGVAEAGAAVGGLFAESTLIGYAGADAAMFGTIGGGVSEAIGGGIAATGSGLFNISGAIGDALSIATAGEISPGLGAGIGQAVVGAGKGALMSGLMGGDPLKGALTGGIGGAVSGLAGPLISQGVSGLGIEGTAKDVISGGLTGALSGTVRSAVGGTDVGMGALTGGAGGAAGGLGSSLAQQAFGVPASSDTAQIAGALFGQGTSYALGKALGAPTAQRIYSTGPSAGAPSVGSPALAGLLTGGGDAGYSPPIMGSGKYGEEGRPSPWNVSSLKTSDALGGG
jgi:hypothetical protein